MVESIRSSSGRGPMSVPDRAWARFEWLVTILARVMSWIGAVAVVGLMLHIIADVAMRYFLGRPLTATIDWVSYWWMILLGFFGFVAATQRGDHIDVTLYSDRLSRSNEGSIRQLSLIMTAIFVASVTWFGWDNALTQMAIRESTGATRIPIWPMRFVVPAAGLVFVLQLVVQLRLMRRHERRRKGSEA